jgi:spermidine synthase
MPVLAKSYPKPKMPFSLLPRTILKTESPVSGEIKIVEQLGKNRLYVAGMLQSGGLLEGVWKKALANINQPRDNLLVLGLGGGTIVRLAAVKWPGVKIVSVEIDPVIIKLSKKFFGMEAIPGLEIVSADAGEWVKKAVKETKKFDLIVVDAYLKDEIPRRCKTAVFLNTIKRLLDKDGVAIFNQLLAEKRKKETKSIIEALKRIFPQTKVVKTSTNLLVLAANKPFQS